MAAPVTYLGATTLTRSSIPGYYTYKDYRQRYKQKRPFNLVLPYYRAIYEIKSHTKGADYGSIIWDANTPPFSVDFTDTNNRSYEKLRGKLYDTVGLGVDIVEYRQSVSMIASTATTLARAALAVKRLRFSEAAALLRMKYLPKGVSKHKSMGNNWLEFHFGWSPLVHDIYDAAKVMNDPLKSYSMETAIARNPFTWTYYRDYGSGIGTGTGSGYYGTKQGTRVKMINSAGAHTLEQWGLTNPAELAWELVPYSFVVDWFVNVGDYLRSFSDFAGMTLENSYTTNFYNISCPGKYAVKPAYGSGAPRLWRTEYKYTQRTTSLTGVTLNVKKLRAPSMSRAATAISLLVKGLK